MMILKSIASVVVASALELLNFLVGVVMKWTSVAILSFIITVPVWLFVMLAARRHGINVSIIEVFAVVYFIRLTGLRTS